MTAPEVAWEVATPMAGLPRTSLPVAEALAEIETELAALVRRAHRNREPGELATIARWAGRIAAGLDGAPAPSRPSSTGAASGTEAFLRGRAIPRGSEIDAHDRSRLHEAAHAIAAEQLGLAPGRIRAWEGHGETQAFPGPVPRALVVALAGRALERMLGCPGADEASASDVAIAESLAGRHAALHGGDAATMLATATAEADRVVRAQLRPIARLAECLEAAGGSLVGGDLVDALDYALEKPRPMPVPGRATALSRADAMAEFSVDRRRWFEVLMARAGTVTPEEQARLWKDSERFALECRPLPADGGDR